MAVQITIAGTIYNFPIAGESPNWGAEATETVVAMAAAINSLLAPGDILPTSATIDNNIVIPTEINGLIFDPNVTRAADISYTVYRTSTSTTAGNAEVSRIFLIYDDNGPVGQKWKITTESNGDAGVVLSIVDSGQMYYTSTDIGSSGYTGSIKFSARTLSR